MKSFVANNPNNLPITIKVTKLSSFEKRGVRKSFLADLLINETNPHGVIRESCFIVNTKPKLRGNKDSESFRSFSVILEKMRRRKFDMIMIKF